MNTKQGWEQDERTKVTANASYRWGFWVLAGALCLDALYRAIVFKQFVLDLLMLVSVSQLIPFIYQARRKTIPLGYGIVAGVLSAISIGFLLFAAIFFAIRK